MAAVLASGDDAVLSHLSAAELWGMLSRARRLSGAGGRGGGAPVDVTVPGTKGMKKRGRIALHRSRTLSPADCTRRNGIPVTTPMRTLDDLRRTLPNPVYAAAVREAEFLGLQVGANISPDHTRSELEAKFLSLLRRHRLPQPEVNVPVDRFIVDFLWRRERLIVELDGWQGHRGRAAFEQDRARDARLKLLRFEVLRFTWRHVNAAPREVVATITGLLARSR